MPSSLQKGLHSVPKATTRKLPKDMTVHGLLAVDICRDTSPAFAKWLAVMPSREDVAASMPLLWPEPLQALLPAPARRVLATQQAKFATDWAHASAGFPELERGAYAHAWLLVNSRTFYHVTRRTQGRPHDDRMVMQPVADLFNHDASSAGGGGDGGDSSSAGEGGGGPPCAVTFDAESYVFKTSRPYARGDEVLVSYGPHPNDLLLVEYGFCLADNRWDDCELDDQDVLAGLTTAERTRLEDVGFLGSYRLDATGPCFRTQVALRARGTAKRDFLRFVVEGEEDERLARAAGARLETLLDMSAQRVGRVLGEIEALAVGFESQRLTLRDRWQQILALIQKARAT